MVDNYLILLSISMRELSDCRPREYVLYLSSTIFFCLTSHFPMSFQSNHPVFSWHTLILEHNYFITLLEAMIKQNFRVWWSQSQFLPKSMPPKKVWQNQISFLSHHQVLPSGHINVDPTLSHILGLTLYPSWFCKHGPESLCDIGIRLK